MPLLSIYLRSPTHGRLRIYSSAHCPEYIRSHQVFDLFDYSSMSMHASDRLQSILDDPWLQWLNYSWPLCMDFPQTAIVDSIY